MSTKGGQMKSVGGAAASQGVGLKLDRQITPHEKIHVKVGSGGVREWRGEGVEG